jgi:glycosyltransferase involved in cell wall biosynthesis
MRNGVERLPAASALHIPEQPEPGVNLAGFLEVESGLGEVARRLAKVLASSDIPFAAIAYRGTLARRDHPLGLELAESAPYDINLISLSANDLMRFAVEVGMDFFARRYSIGVWFWETDVFSSAERATTSAARFLDEVWVASDYVRQAVAPQVDIPVHVVPVPVESPQGPFRTRSELSVPEGFIFLYVFDFWSAERKNPWAVVEAFKRAFEPDEGPTLVLKSIHGRDWKPHQFERLAALVQGRPDILLRDGYVSAGERDSYIAACDCYVSLHRSEGLGLTMAEAMACGKPVIATGYSGNLEFMSEENSHLVPYRLVDIPDTWWAYAAGAQWAEPDVDAAAELMRRVWEDRAEAQALGSKARDDVLERFSPERTAAFVEDRFADVRARGAVQARASVHDARPALLEAYQELAAKGVGESLGYTRGLRPSSLLRRLLQRALWPYLADQRRFEKSVLMALTALQRSIDELERRAYATEARSSPQTHEDGDKWESEV